MKFTLDKNLPIEIAELLKKAGYEAITILEQKRGGKTDQEIIAFCKQENRALLTLDFDFSDIRNYPPSEYPGIIVLKISNQSKNKVIRLAKKILPFLKTEPLKGQLWIVEEKRIRIRE